MVDVTQSSSLGAGAESIGSMNSALLSGTEESLLRIWFLHLGSLGSQQLTLMKAFISKCQKADADDENQQTCR